MHWNWNRLILVGLTTSMICGCGGIAPPPSASRQPTLISISITPANGSYQLPAIQQFTATGHYSDGSTQDITQSATWSSLDTSVATVSNNNGSKGFVKILAVGTDDIVASMLFARGTASITVTNPLTSINVSPASGSYQVGATQQFTATGYYGDGSNKDVTQAATWSSSNTSVATVGNSSGTQGAAAMVGSGSTSITAAMGSVQSAAAISVTSSVTISISPAFASVVVTHQTQAFTATVQGTTNTAVNWAVDGVDGGDSTLGTISSTGVYTPPSTGGMHSITATSLADLGKTASAQVAVMDNPGVFTRQYGNERVGLNSDEIVLTPQNVNQQNFGPIANYPVSGIIFAQPLYVANVNIPNLGYRNVVYVATDEDMVYAFDANGKSSGPIWQTNLLNTSSGETTVPCGTLPGDMCTEMGTIGVIGTPAIDPTTGTFYVDALSENNGVYYHRLHALDITTGAEKFGGPVTIQGSVPGTGAGTDGSSVAFQPYYELQRAGLLLANGNVYIGFASYDDVGPYHGWIFAYNATNLQQVAVYNDTANGAQGGIWQAAGGIAADSSGSVYVTTGNGTFDANAGGLDYGDSILKLSPDLSAMESYFTPYDQSALDSGDLDLGSASPLLLPDQPGSYPHLLIGGGKPGEIYLCNRDSLGGYQSGSNSQIVQSIPNATGMVMTSPAYWNGHIYFTDQNGDLTMFGLNNGQIDTTPQSQISDAGSSGLVISSNGTQDGILWTIQVVPGVGGVLVAYNANDLAQLYDSILNQPQAFGAVVFQAPVAVNGQVFVGAQGQLYIFGLLP